MNAATSFLSPALLSRVKAVFRRPAANRSRADRATLALVRQKVRDLNAFDVDRLCDHNLGKLLKPHLASVELHPAHGPLLIEKVGEDLATFEIAANVHVYGHATKRYFVTSFRINLAGTLSRGTVVWHSATVI